MQVKNAASQQSSVSVYSLLVFASSYAFPASVYASFCVCVLEIKLQVKRLHMYAFYWRCEAEFLKAKPDVRLKT